MSESFPGAISFRRGKQSSRCFVRIADLAICLASADATLPLQLVGAISGFATEPSKPDLRMQVKWGDLSTAESGKKTFDSGALWRLYVDDGTYCFQFHSRALGAAPYKEARVDANFHRGEVSLHRSYFTSGDAVCPFEYPLDELLINHLLARRGGGEVHSCGIVDRSGRGHLFVGHSGAGKTTLARLWQTVKGVKILSDDRIVLRSIDGNIWMYGTPWHGEAKLADPSRAPLARIYFLRHGEKNKMVRQMPTQAVGRLFACSFPPFYDREALARTLAFFTEVVNAVPCHELTFVPDHGVLEGLVDD